MSRKLDDSLASHATEYEVHRQIHDVPPHAVWEISVDGTRAVCKLARGPEADPAVEGCILQYVGTETSVPVPEVLAVGDDYFLTGWCDEAPNSGTGQGPHDPPPITVDLARTLGEGLAKLHAQTRFERTGFPRARDGLVVDGRDTWTETLRDLLAGWHDYLAEYGYDNVANEVLAFVHDHSGLFDGVGAPVLTHGWYTPEHVGVRGGEVTCVLDWEHALIAPGEYDFCRTEVPSFENPARERADGARESFRAGYESVRPLLDGFDVRRRVYKTVIFTYFLVSGRVQRQRPPRGFGAAERIVRGGDEGDARRIGRGPGVVPGTFPIRGEWPAELRRGPRQPGWLPYLNVSH